MTAPFDSYSQNGEDVVLFRALAHIEQGRYIDVGANDPVQDSVTMAFYERGWSGITIEPDPEFAQRQRDRRPRDVLVEAAATAKDDDLVKFHLVGIRGLSTLDDDLATSYVHSGVKVRDVEVPTRRLDRILEEAGWDGSDIHFMSVDTEGAERIVLEGIDLRMWRPWILVVEATSPNTTESTRDQWEGLVTEAGYRFCLFDGLSCFYVAEERADELGPALSYPACTLDYFTTWTFREVIEERERLKPLVAQVIQWRTQAISRWARAVSDELTIDRLEAEVRSLRARLEPFEALIQQNELLEEQLAGLRLLVADIYRSTSWRASRPVRAAGGLLARVRRMP